MLWSKSRMKESFGSMELYSNFLLLLFLSVCLLFLVCLVCFVCLLLPITLSKILKVTVNVTVAILLHVLQGLLKSQVYPETPPSCAPPPPRTQLALRCSDRGDRFEAQSRFLFFDGTSQRAFRPHSVLSFLVSAWGWKGKAGLSSLCFSVIIVANRSPSFHDP